MIKVSELFALRWRLLGAESNAAALFADVEGTTEGRNVSVDLRASPFRYHMFSLVMLSYRYIAGKLDA